jgi:hypothetical protein
MMSTVRAMLHLILLALVACGASTDEAGSPSARPADQRDRRVPVASVKAVNPNSSSDPAPEPSPPTAPEPARGSEPRDAHALVPPGGTYVYDVTGYTERGSGTTRRRESVPPEQTDRVTTADDATRVRTISGGDETETVLEVHEQTAYLVRLSSTQEEAGQRITQTVRPRPPVPLARAPYRIGDRWDYVWKDESFGLTGAGTGAVLREQSGTIVLEHVQKIRGSMTSDIVTTLWIDPSSGTQIERRIVTDSEGPTGPSHSETTAVLRR